MAKVSHMQRSLKVFKNIDYIVGIVEHWNSFTHQRQDLFGVIDAIGVSPVDGIVAIQVCGQDYMEHVTKILSNPVAPEWCKHSKFYLIGWKKLTTKVGAKAQRWYLRLGEFTNSNGKIEYTEITAWKDRQRTLNETTGNRCNNKETSTTNS